MDDFERELRVAFARRLAPPNLKRKIVGRRWQQASRSHRRMIWLERIAASLILATVAGGSAFWHHELEERRAEEARQQVMTALRIAGQALEQVNTQLTDNDRDEQ
ncbi:MAG: hypothetical protein ABSD59_00470 [Terracidiphilus sp.]